MSEPYNLLDVIINDISRKVAENALANIKIMLPAMFDEQLTLYKERVEKIDSDAICAMVIGSDALATRIIHIVEGWVDLEDLVDGKIVNAIEEHLTSETHLTIGDITLDNDIDEMILDNIKQSDLASEVQDTNNRLDQVTSRLDEMTVNIENSSMSDHLFTSYLIGAIKRPDTRRLLVTAIMEIANPTPATEPILDEIDSILENVSRITRAEAVAREINEAVV